VLAVNLLITGGAGYIGSHVVDLLIEEGHSIVVFDNLSTGHREAVHASANFIEGDLLDLPTVLDLFSQDRFDGIFHFASHTLVGESMQLPWLYLRNNVLAATHLLEAAVQNDVKRIILSSTANLFDAPQRIPIAETESVIPGSPYGESKAMIERQLYWMDRIYGIKHCALRYFNASGAHPNGHIGEDHTPETHLIPIILQVALEQREHVTVFGSDYNTPDGTCIRDYIHVVDLATAHIRAFEAIGDGTSRRFNLGNGKGYSIQEVVEVARNVTGHPIPVVMGDRREGDPAELVADSEKFMAETGWKPRFSTLESIIETAWRWHQSHPLGYKTRAE
jgi:UDP-glucose 4-epimerase